jgi:hypothetical protein
LRPVSLGDGITSAGIGAFALLAALATAAALAARHMGGPAAPAE